MLRSPIVVLLACLLLVETSSTLMADADLILHNGHVITVDKAFSIQQAVAVTDGVLVHVGSNDGAMKHKGDKTTVIDLKGKTLMPGLMDSHTHATGAAMFEFDHDIPNMQSIADVLAYVKSRANTLDDGEWIFVSQVFITRLNERRYPTRVELDKAAPKHPVMFRTGPDASLNSLALKRSGIDKDFKGDGGPGYLEKVNGEPTGILRGCTRYAKYVSPKSGKSAVEQDRYHRLLTLFKDYNAVGLTAIADRASSSSSERRYKKMFDNGDLPVRVMCSHNIGTGGNPNAIAFAIKKVAEGDLAKDKSNRDVRIVGTKIFLDGGMLTGSARMRKAWGLSKIYSITDPQYKGVFRTDPAKLETIINAAVEGKLQFTAHSVGDGAVHALIDAYITVKKTRGNFNGTRPCITHSNFMSLEAVEKMAKHGIVADIQPAWLWLDTRTLSKQFDNDRLRYFQPLRTIFEKGAIAGGGSDHMQKIGSMRSVNPYNPWLGMWVTITRNARDYKGQLHPEEALSREQAIRFYTANNAHILFLDDVAGSLEKGKHADMIVIDRNILKCDVNDIKDTRVLRTYLKGRLVYGQKSN